MAGASWKRVGGGSLAVRAGRGRGRLRSGARPRRYRSLSASRVPFSAIKTVAAEHQVLRRLARPGPSVHVAGDATCRLAHHQLLAVAGFADRLRTGRQDSPVRSHRSEPAGPIGGVGTHRSSHTSTPSVYRDRRRYSSNMRSFRQRVATLTGNADLGRVEDGGRGRGEVAGVVKLAVGWQVCLWHHDRKHRLPRQHTAATLNSRPSKADTAFQRQRCRRYMVAGDPQTSQARSVLMYRPLQRPVVEQVAAGVAGQPQLGEHDQVAPHRLGLPSAGRACGRR